MNLLDPSRFGGYFHSRRDDMQQSTYLERAKQFRIAGLTLPLFLAATAVFLVATYLNVIPKNMVGAFFMLLLFGELLNLIGNHLPIIRSYFGGGPIVMIFGGSALVYYGIINENLVKISDQFMKSPGGFLDFYIAALITGSLLGMNRKLLIKASLRFLPVILAGVAVALGLVMLVAPLLGETPATALAYIGIPIMGGGMGAGAVPIADVMSGALQIPNKEILSKLVPAVALGNAIAIVAAGLLDKLGKVKPSWTGNGQMLARGHFEVEPFEESKVKISDYMVGILTAVAFFSFGAIISKLLAPYAKIHAYAFMILAVALCKAFNVLPEYINKACAAWFRFVATNFTSLLMLGLGISYTNLGDVIAAFSPMYIILCFVVVLGAIIGTALVGKLMGLNPIEAALTAGLCMANMGGTGDVAVLTAAHRMELMPFAQISSRLGGAFIIFLATILVPIFF